MKIGTEERRRRQKKKCKTSNHNTIEKQQIAREKGKNRDHEYIYTYILMKNYNDIGTEERRRMKKEKCQNISTFISIYK